MGYFGRTDDDYEQKHFSKSSGLHQESSSGGYKNKGFDLTYYAYREAVSRLKMMLADSYAPQKYSGSASSIFKSVTDDDTDTDQQTIIERPAFKEVSKYFPHKPYTPYSTTSNYLTKPYTTLQPPGVSDSLVPATTQPPSELLNFIEKQETYIEQLERESSFCREELSSLLNKVKDVISENETLTGKMKFEREEAAERASQFAVTSGPNILFESRISELEAHLAQSNIDYKKLCEENQELRKKMAHGGSGEGTVDQQCSEAYKRQIENLQRDKLAMEDSVKKLQKQIAELKESDIQNYSKTQKNLDFAEQAHFERTQAEIEIRRLKDELERQHARVREIQHEMTKRVAEERCSAERRYNYQVDQLGGDLTSQFDLTTKLQVEMERQKRAESDLKRELSQKSAQIDELKNEMKLKNNSHLSDLAQTNAEKQSLEQEITALRMQLERADRHTKTESSRLNAEISSLRQRLDRADADLLHSRRENLRLCDQISSLEKEIALGNLGKDHKPVKDVATIISEMESKHDPIKHQDANEWNRTDTVLHSEPIPNIPNTSAIYGTSEVKPEQQQYQQPEETRRRSGSGYDNQQASDVVYPSSSRRASIQRQQPLYEESPSPPSRPLSRTGSRKSISDEPVKRMPDSIITTTTIEESVVDTTTTRQPTIRDIEPTINDERNIQYQQSTNLGGDQQPIYEDRYREVTPNPTTDDYENSNNYVQQPETYDMSDYNTNNQYSTNNYGQESTVGYQSIEPQPPMEQYNTNGGKLLQEQPIPENETFYAERQQKDQYQREQEERERERLREEEEREAQRLREEREAQRLREEQEREAQRLREEQEREAQRIKQEQEQKELELRKSITPTASPQPGSISPQLTTALKTPQSPTRNPNAKRGPIKQATDKRGSEQKEGRGALGEAGARKTQPEYLQKQPSKTATSRPGVKGK